MTNLLKFSHLLFALGLFSLTIYCFALLGSKVFSLKNDGPDKITQLNKVIILLSGGAMLTGSLLIHPKHYTFHTPWIQAAYGLLLLYVVGILLLISMKKKHSQRWQWRIVYFILITVLIAITHDAVTKTTLF